MNMLKYLPSQNQFTKSINSRKKSLTVASKMAAPLIQKVTVDETNSKLYHRYFDGVSASFDSILSCAAARISTACRCRF